MFETAAVLGVGIAMLAVVGTPVAVGVVAGPGYEPSVAVLRILAVAIALSFLVATWGLVLLALRRHTALLVANGIAFVAAAGSSIVLIPSAHARGAAVAVLAAELTLTTVYGVLLTWGRSSVRFSPRRGTARARCRRGRVCRRAAAPAPAAVALLLAAVVYSAAVVGLGLMPPEVLDSFRLTRTRLAGRRRIPAGRAIPTVADRVR